MSAVVERAVAARRIRGQRALTIALRTVHLAGVSVLLGGHAFAVAPERLVPALAVSIASGAALVAVEVAASASWIVTGAGLTVAAKLALLLLVPVFWEHRVAIMLAALVVASVGAHMPARFRHRVLLRR